jgi:hypothetical protein
MRLVIFLAAAAFAADPEYTNNVEQYRAQREASLKQDDGWLTVVGLFRLKEGENSVGSGEGSQVTLPLPAPAHAGKITFSKGQAIYYAEGRPGTILRPNIDVVTLKSIKFFAIKRGDEYMVRVKDNNSKLRRTRDGKEYRLEPVREGRELLFIFRDATSNKSTYGAARFLYAEPAKNGVVNLDFNKAINPPCAFTPYATCPLPPPQNRLTLAVTAGEKKYSDAVER